MIDKRLLKQLENILYLDMYSFESSKKNVAENYYLSY